VDVESTSENNYAYGAATPAQITVSPSNSKITLITSAREVNAGDEVTLTGQLTWRSPQGWRPLANKQIGVLYCTTEDYCWDIDYPLTDKDGRYELTAPVGVTGYFRVAFPSYDPFIARSAVEVAMIAWQPAEFTDFTAARNEAGDVVAQGHMRFGSRTPSPTTVQIQYRAAGTHTWTTLATINYWESEYGFSATILHPTTGHWRAYFTGQPNMFRPTASAPVLVP
jgi:hypothetical protein